jgi:hypothetical protein
LPEKQTTPRGPKRDPPGRLSGISGYTNLKKCLLVGRETKSIPQDSVKFALHISEVKLETFVNSAFHFAKVLF